MKILLVSHEASRTGAPRVAALVARSLIAQGHRVHILSRARGPLEEDFAAEAPTRVEFLSRTRRRFRRLPLPTWVSRIVDSTVAFATIIRDRPDLVYINSTAAAIYIRPAQLLHRRVLVHSHESGSVAQRFLEEALALDHLTDLDLIACSPSVQRELAEISGRQPTTIHMIPSVPDDARVLSLASDVDDHYENALVVGCCGSVEHRKGADLWIAAAREVRRLLPEEEIRFVWVGAFDGVPENQSVGDVEFVGPRANPYPLMRSFDVATLPSRDDPFPLVVLESMILGKPVVAFDVGAVAEQIGLTGVLVPPGDVREFARAVVDLLTDRDKRESLGRAAAERARAQFSTTAFGQKLTEVIAPTSP